MRADAPIPRLIGTVHMPLFRAAFLILSCALSASAAPPAAKTIVSHVTSHPSYLTAAAEVATSYQRFIAEIVALTEIPAPTFDEAARAERFASLARDAGLSNVEIDKAGNVLALRKGGGGPLLVIAAHLDTVFPKATEVTVRRSGTRLAAPGIGDNALGLAALLAVARAMNAANIETTSDILFVANVAEEGEGDLRGVKHLFNAGAYRGRIRTFVSIDGGGGWEFLTTRGVGSRRYRVTFSGPGGHSYGAFGLVNPAHALAEAIQTIGRIPVPSSPKTTFNVGTIGGGTSVNTIPSSAWMDVDLRSESGDELAKLDAAFQSAVRTSVSTENSARMTTRGAVLVDVSLVGDRPFGATSEGSELVQTVLAVAGATGVTPQLGASSTDANLPMSLGIPAVTIDTGLAAGRAHAPDEWIDVEESRGIAGLQRVLLLVTSLAGIR